jgi:hypothetical protein
MTSALVSSCSIVYNDRERLKAECEQLRSLLDNMNAQLELRASTQAYGAWYWQGAGGDHLKSMSNGMSVVIRVGQLRELIKAEQEKGGRPVHGDDLADTCPGFVLPAAYEVLARFEPEDLYPLWREGKHCDVSHGAAFADVRQ